MSSQSGSKVISFADSNVIERGDGIETVMFSDPPAEGQDFIMGITSFPPGASLARHSHNCVEQVTLLAGSGVVEVAGEQVRLRQYDTTQVPAGEAHRFENDSEEPMRILWVYGSTHVTRTFTDTGETVSNHGKPSGS
ncbi:MAG: cupin domain-containing protein [Acidimicrobiales bacterium]